MLPASFEQVSASQVLLDGLYDPESSLSRLMGPRDLVMRKIWKMVGKDWLFYPEENLEIYS